MPEVATQRETLDTGVDWSSPSMAEETDPLHAPRETWDRASSKYIHSGDVWVWMPHEILKHISSVYSVGISVRSELACGNRENVPLQMDIQGK